VSKKTNYKQSEDMNRNHFLYDDWRADDEPEEEEKEEQPKSDLMMFSKRLEKYFF
jgi:hypothetical protein